MKNTLWILLMLGCYQAFSQTNTAAKDTLIWTDGTVYSGAILKEEKGDVKFITDDGTTHTIPRSSIAQLKRAGDKTDDKLPLVDAKPSQAPVHTQSQTSMETVEPAINWSDPSIPHKVLVKHRMGIGLTVTGVGLITAGIGMIAAGAASNGETTTTTNGYSVQASANIGAVGVIGVVAVIAGLPMMIVGAVKIAKAKKLARAGNSHFR